MVCSSFRVLRAETVVPIDAFAKRETYSCFLLQRITPLTMEPSEALSTAAQIAVALAGFAGVVVVFRRESVHDWSAIDKFRLRLLLTNSILPLALCVIGLLFLTIKPPPVDIWKWSRGIAF